ncbi:XapX domain-containing protein [Alkalihalobacillus sp. BA299]|uniref:XapX domain-containing protein n=1 Tax=Alkalihalobacillus sp. BA299 TaxID=2815938 RepID=UPI001ADD59E3|nr:XapX domain-containing protein [Alkalihalobacillus sp. BA299]
MQEIIMALLAGLIVGLLFAFIKLPIPAPPAFPGIAGIIGIYLGYKLLQWILPYVSG